VRDDRVYLEHILECINRIERGVSAGKSEFPRATCCRTLWFVTSRS